MASASGENQSSNQSDLSHHCKGKRHHTDLGSLQLDSRIIHCRVTKTFLPEKILSIPFHPEVTSLKQWKRKIGKPLVFLLESGPCQKSDF